MEDSLRAHEVIVILDFGSQYSHLIARRLREAHVFCSLLAHDTPASELARLSPKGIILSGGPFSVYSGDAPHADAGIFALGVPILGICYGLQELAHALGGAVVSDAWREFGHADLRLLQGASSCALLEGLPALSQAWMSHADRVSALPDGFRAVAETDNSPFAAITDERREFFGLQFHPEVTHTAHGGRVLANFATGVCGCRGDWSMRSFAEEMTAMISASVGDARVIGAVSGGVDSTVAAVLMTRAIGDRFHALLVDNGLLRRDEAEEVMRRLKGRCGVNVARVDAGGRFLAALEGVTEPERKRSVIGETFIRVFEEEAREIDAAFLLQGTLYPDVIESVSHKGPSATIKTHHNVGGLPESMRLKLIEPLRFLFKDEVRALGLELGVERESIARHPFPGPGLAIRILGEITQKRLAALRDADAIFIEALHEHGLYEQIGQAFAVLLPVKAVGVMGDRRTYEEVIALRAVKTSDYMTADWFDLPARVLREVSTRIVNEVAGINRVVYDVTSKPPGTIEWE